MQKKDETQISLPHTPVGGAPNKACLDIESFVKEVQILQKYTQFQVRNSFFYDMQSREVGEITKALVDFIADLPKLKATTNAMGRYKYQTFPELLEAVNPILSKHDIKIMQPPHSIGDGTYIVTKVVHTSGQYFRCVTAIPKEYMMAGKMTKTDENLQAMGGAQTYIKRYALKAMLGIDADEDNDGGGTIQTPQKTYGKSNY